MRPPRQSWKRASDATQAVVAALEQIQSTLQGTQLNCRPVRVAIEHARAQADELEEHVNSSEECEEP